LLSELLDAQKPYLRAKFALLCHTLSGDGFRQRYGKPNCEGSVQQTIAAIGFCSVLA
jgi:hypothetical protein